MRIFTTVTMCGIFLNLHLYTTLNISRKLYLNDQTDKWFLEAYEKRKNRLGYREFYAKRSTIKENSANVLEPR